MDMVTHSELGPVSLCYLRLSDVEFQGSELTSFTGIALEPGDLVFIVENYRDVKDASVGGLRDISRLQNWEDLADESLAIDISCSVCGEEGDVLLTSDDSEWFMFGHESCIDSILEAAQMLIERNSELVSARVM